MTIPETKVNIKEFPPDSSFMFCCHESNNLIHELYKNNIATDITATIIHNNMDDYDWNLVSTDGI